jgi:hypothetical protein
MGVSKPPLAPSESHDCISLTVDESGICSNDLIPFTTRAMYPATFLIQRTSTISKRDHPAALSSNPMSFSATSFVNWTKASSNPNTVIVVDEKIANTRKERPPDELRYCCQTMRCPIDLHRQLNEKSARVKCYYAIRHRNLNRALPSRSS